MLQDEFQESFIFMKKLYFYFNRQRLPPNVAFIDLIGSKVVCDIRNTSDFKVCF